MIPIDFDNVSIKGYVAVAYLQIPITFKTSYAPSKSRVAPLKKLTLPRLELMAATTAARIADYLKTLFNVKECNIYCFSDSQIMLHCIKGYVNNWKPFIANRVRQIQTLISPQWQFCKGTENSADVVSRGAKFTDSI
ncbi:hypothetical protein X975_18741, partial [Stegodyphus mimosarum]